MEHRKRRRFLGQLSLRLILSVCLLLSVLAGVGVAVQPAQAQAWEQTITPRGAGFSDSGGGWVRIATQNTVQCSTDPARVIYTQTRTPPNTNDVDWARWRPSIPSTGQYDVLVYIPRYTNTRGVTTQARYVINHAGGATTVVRDQNQNQCSWVSLGRYTFPAGTDGSVYLGDYTGDGTIRLIAADGMKFVAAPVTYAISGTVTDAENNPFGNVTLTLNTGQTATTDANGSFRFAGLAAGTYTLTPSSASGYVFAPASRTVNVTADSPGQSFTITNRYAISGTIADTNGAPLPNISVTLQGLTRQATTTTDSAGRYRFYNLIAGLYQVRPSGTGVQFSPAVRGWMLIPPNAAGQNFSTAPRYGTLSGQVLAGTQAVADATVNVAGKSARTAADGRYTLTNLLPGVHTLSVSATGYQPSQTTVTIRESVAAVANVTLAPVRAEGYRMPFPGGATYRLSRSSGHSTGYAQDWAGAGINGSPVVASRAGRVVFVKENSNSGGCSARFANAANYVVIQHADNTRTVYVHLQQNSVPVRVGETVRSGQIIGRVGRTGYFCGDHLHFHWLVNGKRAVINLLDIPGGVPRDRNSYTSGNFLTANFLFNAEAAVLADTTAPVGSVQLRLTGQATYQVQLDIFDFDSDAIQMRLAPSEADLAAAPWFTATTSLDWDQPAVWAQFKDAAGNESDIYSDTLEPIVYEPLQAGFEVAPTVCVGTEPVIENTTFPLSPQLGWQWDYGDGNVSQAMDGSLPDVYLTGIYTEAGTYTMRLTVAGLNDTQTVTQTIEALPAPSPEFALTRRGTTITVTANAAAAEYRWDFGDGATATGRTATHTYASAAEMEAALVTLEVIDANGCESDGFLAVALPNQLYLPLLTR